MPKPDTPLSAAESMLLCAFMEFLREEDAARFHARCDLIDTLVAAAKAKVRLDRIERNLPARRPGTKDTHR